MGRLLGRFLKKIWKAEAPTGSINGSNVTFTLSEAPQETDSLQVFVNGLYQTPTTDYSLSGTTITFTYAPETGSILRVEFIQKGGE